MECLSFCIANKIDLSRVDHYYKTGSDSHQSIKSHDVVKLLNDNKGCIFIFANGTVVSWGVKRHQIYPYLTTIKQFAQKHTSNIVHDEFSYRLGHRVNLEPHGYFDVDCITIDTDSDDLKLSLSYGFSQSVKLQYYEALLEGLIDKYSPLIHILSSQGEMNVSRNEIRKIIGEILGAKSELNLVSNFLYHPKYFWQHPTLEEYFIMLERYLHIERRVSAINHRLDTLNEIFDMFNGYLENRHSHSLELIIIILIAIEIVFGVLNFHF